MQNNVAAFNRLEMRRFEARITVDDLAKAAGSHPETYYRWRSAAGPTPTDSSLEQWGAALDRLIDAKIDILRDQIDILRKLKNKGAARPRDAEEMANGREAQEHR